MKSYIGIDWSEQWHDVCFMNQAGKQLALFEIEHNPAGFAELISQIEHMQVPVSQCRVAIETTYNLVVDFLWAKARPV